MICLFCKLLAVGVSGRGETGEKQRSDAGITLPGVPDGLGNCNPWGVTKMSGLGYGANWVRPCIILRKSLQAKPQTVG